MQKLKPLFDQPVLLSKWVKTNEAEFLSLHATERAMIAAKMPPTISCQPKPVSPNHLTAHH